MAGSPAFVHRGNPYKTQHPRPDPVSHPSGGPRSHPRSGPRYTASVPCGSERKLYPCPMTAIDQLEDALKANDRRIVREAHTVIRETGRKIKKHFCRNYRYPDVDPAVASLWSVLCTSGIGSAVSARSLS